MPIPGFADQAPVDVFRRSVKDYFDDDMLTYASALSYHLVLALFPFVIFLLALFGAVGLTSVFDDQLQQARAALPPEAFQLISQVIDQIRSQSRPGLLSGSILVSLWAASAAMRSITIALNVAYDVSETRPAWRRYLISFLATIGLALLLLVAGLFQIIGPQAAEWLASHPLGH